MGFSIGVYPSWKVRHTNTPVSSEPQMTRSPVASKDAWIWVCHTVGPENFMTTFMSSSRTRRMRESFVLTSMWSPGVLNRMPLTLRPPDRRPLRLRTSTSVRKRRPSV